MICHLISTLWKVVSDNVPEGLEMDAVIHFPTCFRRDVEPLIEFKLFNKLYAQRDGAWVQLKI